MLLFFELKKQTQNSPITFWGGVPGKNPAQGV